MENMSGGSRFWIRSDHSTMTRVWGVVSASFKPTVSTSATSFYAICVKVDKFF